jgi:hypothetical protein
MTERYTPNDFEIEWVWNQYDKGVICFCRENESWVSENPNGVP